MKISDEGFKITTGTDGVDKLLFDSSRAKECAGFAVKNNLRRIMLNPHHGYLANDIEPIIPLKDFIDGLIIGSEKIRYENIELFKNLNFLGLPDNQIDTVDLSDFPNLTVLACMITERLKGLEACKNLKSLTFSYYKPKSNDLTSLPALESLQHLSIIVSGIITLRGIERYCNLRKLEIFQASKLERILQLQSISNLVEIEFDKCKNLRDWEILGNMQSLKKIIISDSGSFKNLAFVKRLPNLEFISFCGTNVLDGNIRYCEGIKYVGFDDKRHYTHKMKDFKERCHAPEL
ncbi:MAG TPA: hypothetical protein DET40_04775 [Lentisphaeria bacterium]|nr:MAG: hypothetical protein A2X45_13350 [Lentisphaerae bacterium GWF2_50_93]HCE42839.1 hypothetical protein [Lentisphaeria bacterium]